MKKYHLYLWLIALVGLFAACSQDETADALQTANESNRVTLTASLPDDFAQIGTRALPTANGHKLRCILEIWTKDATPVLKQRIEKTDLSGDNVTFDFKIDQGEYNCLFWADFIATNATEHTDAQIGSVTYKHYDDKYYITNDATNGLKAIVINTSNYAFNTDARDAFFGVYELTKTAAAIENQTIPSLTRPFAKLTIKEKDATNYSYCTGLTAKYEIPTTFNVLDKAVGNATVDLTCSGKSSESTILFSDYIFTNAASTLGAIELTFTATDKELLPVTIPAGIPIQRNYKTNASGNLISEKPAPTNGVKLTVTMDARWTGEEDEDLDAWDGKYPTSEAQAKEWMGTESEEGNNDDGSKHVFTITAPRQLAALHYLTANAVEMANAASNAKYSYATYKLAADIDLDNHPWTPIGQGFIAYSLDGIFDGQGHTIRGMNITGNYGVCGFFAAVGGVVKHLNVKGRVAPVFTASSQVYCGGIAGMVFGPGACIAFSSFEGTMAVTHSNSIYAGGIAGQVGFYSYGQILSCYSVVTDMTLGGAGSHQKGGITGYIDKNSSVLKGCYWQTLTGITEAYGTKKDAPTVEGNASFADAAGANAAVNAMNDATPTGYDYQWQAGTGGNYPVLVKKQP